MNFKLKTKTKGFLKFSVFAVSMGLIAMYSTSISNYLIDSYNHQLEFLLSNMSKASNPFRF